jgi:hypothetical protein
MKTLKDALEVMFDVGFKSYVNSIKRENKRKNTRLFKLLAKIVNDGFVIDLKAFMKAIDRKDNLWRIVREPIGTPFKDRRFSTIKTIWVDQKASAEDGEIIGSVCIQVKPNRWIILNY